MPSWARVMSCRPRRSIRMTIFSPHRVGRTETLTSIPFDSSAAMWPSCGRPRLLISSFASTLMRTTIVLVHPLRNFHRFPNDTVHPVSNSRRTGTRLYMDITCIHPGRFLEDRLLNGDYGRTFLGYAPRLVARNNSRKL